MDELAALLSEAANRDFQKWPRLGRYIWPNPGFYVTPTNYAGVINAMKNWIQGRYYWIDSQFLIPPTFSLAAGRIPPGASVSLSGTPSVYYTLDGSDPRLPGGALSSKAALYGGPIRLSENTRLIARIRSGSKWSGPAAASYIVEPASLIISEIMYHPAPPSEESALTAEDFEFIEFKNAGVSPLELQGFRISGGVSFLFPDYTLNPGARVLVVKNRAAFESRHGTGLPIVGEYGGQLDNSGERITVTGPFQETVLSFVYNDSWHAITDGPGFSLAVVDETVSSEKPSDPASWRPGALYHGSPGQGEPPAAVWPSVVVNEALTRPAFGQSARVELQNLSTSAADISGWFLTDNFDKPKKLRIPAATIIPPSGFIVLTGSDFKSGQALEAFSLDPLGEEIYLFSGDAATNLTGYVHGFEYGAQKTDVTFGRHVNNAGEESFVTQSFNTLDDENSGPSVPPLVMSEIMYHPPDVLVNGAYWNNTEDEYIELSNRSAAVVPLFDPAIPTNRWRITGEVEFVFPPGAAVGPGERLLLVNFDPALDPAQLAAFRQKYRVPAGTRLFGPYEGNLDNQRGTINLAYPDTPLPDGTVPYPFLEQAVYSSDPPWPAGADAMGFALSRRDLAQFANDPANWIASTPTPGGANAVQPEPAILQNPVGQLAFASETFRLTVVASGQDPVRYQWRFNGENIPGGDAATLTLTNVQPEQSGAYAVVVSGPESSRTSGPAYVFIGRDNDRDGMDDDWELDQRLNPFDPSDGVADADGDGLSNRHEYLAGTNAHDPQSYLQVGQISVGVATVLIFEAEANRTYTIQYTDSLHPPVWRKLADINSQTAGHTVTAIDPLIESTRYYRVTTPIQP